MTRSIVTKFQDLTGVVQDRHAFVFAISERKQNSAGSRCGIPDLHKLEGVAGANKLEHAPSWRGYGIEPPTGIREGPSFGIEDGLTGTVHPCPPVAVEAHVVRGPIRPNLEADHAAGRHCPSEDSGAFRNHRAFQLGTKPLTAKQSLRIPAVQVNQLEGKRKLRRRIHLPQRLFHGPAATVECASVSLGIKSPQRSGSMCRKAQKESEYHEKPGQLSSFA
jgi:hypothetical protein